MRAFGCEIKSGYSYVEVATGMREEPAFRARSDMETTELMRARLDQIYNAGHNLDREFRAKFRPICHPDADSRPSSADPSRPSRSEA